jgi:hypothetical protein
MPTSESPPKQIAYCESYSATLPEQGQRLVPLVFF